MSEGLLNIEVNINKSKKGLEGLLNIEVNIIKSRIWVEGLNIKVIKQGNG